MEKQLKTITNILIFLLPIVLIIYFIKPDLYREIIKEDGFVEYLTALLLLVISVFLFIKVIKNKGSKGSAWVVFNVLISLGLFFGFGEEISWGQRIFNITPNDFFIENNLQKETNIHNLMINEVKINKWVFSYALSIIFGLYFFLLQVAYKKITYIKNSVDKLGIPVPKNKHIIAFALVTLLILGIPDGKKWELWECYFAVILLSIYLSPYNIEEKLL